MSIFKWKIQMHPKPRGLWRPEVEITFWAEGANELNIDPSYMLPTVRDAGWNPRSDTCTECPYSEKLSQTLQAPFRAFSSASARDETPAQRLCYCYGNSFLFYDKKIILFLEPPPTISFFVEWRPGRADYSDVVEWLAENICKPFAEKFERRWQEAEASEPLGQHVVTSDDIFRKEVGKELATRTMRKLKVV